jgi:hypothetical protein
MTSISKLEKDLSSHKSTVDRLTTDKAKAQEAADQAQEHLRNLWLEGADAKVIAQAEGKSAAKQYTLSAVTDALRIAQERATESERQLANAKDQTIRERRATELRSQAAAIESAHAALGVPLEKFAAALKAAPSAFPAAEAAQFLETFIPQLAGSVTAARAELEAQAVMALSGSPPKSESASVVGIGLKWGVR